MKITKSTLKKIVQEELTAILEQGQSVQPPSRDRSLPQDYSPGEEQAAEKLAGPDVDWAAKGTKAKVAAGVATLKEKHAANAAALKKAVRDKGVKNWKELERDHPARVAYRISYRALKKLRKPKSGVKRVAQHHQHDRVAATIKDPAVKKAVKQQQDIVAQLNSEIANKGGEETNQGLAAARDTALAKIDKLIKTHSEAPPKKKDYSGRGIQKRIQDSQKKVEDLKQQLAGPVDPKESRRIQRDIRKSERHVKELQAVLASQ